MQVAEIYRLNYYVGALLAQGGNLWFEGSKIVFSPTSALDRAMGARNVEIAFQQIREMEYKGELSRTFILKTDDRIHKFEGAQAKKVWEILQKALPNGKETASEGPDKNVAHLPKSSPVLACDQCSKRLEPGYSFCPHCGNRLKSACTSCHRSVDPAWSACAFCGWKFKSGLTKAA